MSDVVFCKTLKEMAVKIEKEVEKNHNDALYAVQQGLNNTAFRARGNLFENYKATFKIHNKGFFTENLKKGVYVKRANYRRQQEDMEVNIRFPYDWFRFHAFGGTKTAEDLKYVNAINKHLGLKVIPIPTERGSVTLNDKGRISRGSTAGKMLSYYFTHPKKTKGHVSKPNAFIMKKVAGGHDVIAKRNRSNKTSLDFFYVLVPEVKIPKRWDFYGIIQKTFDRHLEREYKKAVEYIAAHPYVPRNQRK